MRNWNVISLFLSLGWAPCILSKESDLRLTDSFLSALFLSCFSFLFSFQYNFIILIIFFCLSNWFFWPKKSDNSSQSFPWLFYYRPENYIILQWQQTWLYLQNIPVSILMAFSDLQLPRLDWVIMQKRGSCSHQILVCSSSACKGKIRK